VASPRVLLVDNHDSYSYNLVHLIAGVAGREPDVVTVDRVTPAQAATYDAVVISPGPGHPATEPDFAACLDIVRGGQVPVLGVCLGHQAIGQAFGGRVVRARQVMHGKVSRVAHDGKGVFSSVPEGFLATRYHSLAVERESLPGCLAVTAQSEDGEIMGLRHRELPVEGVQFHPEALLTEHGHRMLQNFIEGRKP
jgi:anthranilate synthase/aminodeoxychorismate synthase-like glutamine amidotransferase